MPRSTAGMLILAVGALALAATGCATVPDGSVEAAAVECPEGSTCYDVPRAIGDGGTFTVSATEFKFFNPSGVYWAGDIQVTLQNEGGAEHNIIVQGANEGSEIPIQALPGESATGIVNLFEGDYIFYCGIPGHRSQGMEAELTVFPTQDAAQENLTESPVEETGDAPADAPTGEQTAGPTDTPSQTSVPTPAGTGSASPIPSGTATGG